MRVGIYPGSFDPITLGHWDVVERCLKIVDTLVIAVASNEEKNPLFSTSQRVSLIRHDLEMLYPGFTDKVLVDSFDGLLVNFARSHGSHLIIRGLRAFADFDFELQLAAVNSKLDSTVETVFLNASDHVHFISSRVVKQIARLGGDIHAFVSPAVAKALLDAFVL